MKKKCAVPVPAGYANPSAVLPALYLWAKGHTTGKKSQLPGKLTTALGKQASLMASAYHTTHPTVCHYMPGQRHTPNPQRGRPRSQAKVIQGPTLPRGMSIFAAAAAPGENSTQIWFHQLDDTVTPVTQYIYTTVPRSVLVQWAQTAGSPDVVNVGYWQWFWSEERGRNWLLQFNRTVLRPYCETYAAKNLSVTPIATFTIWHGS
jgi:hypothetical protein